MKVYRESYKLYKVSPLKFNPFPESRRRLNVPTVTVTLPTKDIIVDPMSLAGIEPPPALQTNISPLDTQSDMNIYHELARLSIEVHGQGIGCPGLMCLEAMC